ncbi:hypothetical protein Acor_65950 [Acrocarpospora corrugata]|uniref:Uncharacterized protein n=1 Tax=Acrocarpospora corrugata TaxID=35763 RepID=A0A5M3W654_9ACTN|nr:hypothetical protein Acor_65950 [Acrocarpospora corrugata]
MPQSATLWPVGYSLSYGSVLVAILTYASHHRNAHKGCDQSGVSAWYKGVSKIGTLPGQIGRREGVAVDSGQEAAAGTEHPPLTPAQSRGLATPDAAVRPSARRAQSRLPASSVVSATP